APDSNAAFRAALKSAVTSAGAPAPTEAAGSTYGGDRWMQDIMELGFSSMPRVETPGPPADPVQAAKWHLPVVMRTPNDRNTMGWGKLDRFSRDELFGPDFGWLQTQTPSIGSSLNSFGNLECSPPVTVA